MTAVSKRTRSVQGQIASIRNGHVLLVAARVAFNMLALNQFGSTRVLRGENTSDEARVIALQEWKRNYNTVRRQGYEALIMMENIRPGYRPTPFDRQQIMFPKRKKAMPEIDRRSFSDPLAKSESVIPTMGSRISA